MDRVHRELTDEEIAQIAGTYHAWRGDAGAGEYEDVPGFCKTATTEAIRGHGDRADAGALRGRGRGRGRRGAIRGEDGAA